MEQVCKSFYRGDLFYSDSFQIENEKHLRSATSLNSIQPIILGGEIVNQTQKVLILHNNYHLKKGFSAVAVLQEILFSKTSMDCNGAIQLAYYLTLLDAFKLFYKTNAQRIFDEIFTGNEEDFSGLSFGTMGNCLPSSPDRPLSPIHYFVVFDETITLDHLKASPEKYIGARFRMGGSPKYLTKHLSGSASGWNIVFKELKNGEPIFLGAMNQATPYTMTLAELKEIMISSFNKFPAWEQKSYARFYASKNDPNAIIGFINGAISFDFKRLYEELHEVKNLKSNLTKFIRINSKDKIPIMPAKDSVQIRSQFFISPRDALLFKKKLDKSFIFADDTKISQRKKQPMQKIHDDIKIVDTQIYRYPSR